MSKNLLLKQYSLLLLSLFMLLTAFTKTNNDKIAATKAGITITNNSQSPVPQVLDTLWAEGSAFTNLHAGKTLFIFRFWLPDSITLNGWHAKGILRHGYDSTPAIQLFAGRKGGTSYPTGTYFGNVILKGVDLKKIKHSLSSTKLKYVIFIPKIEKQQIGYDIFLSDDYPASPTLKKTLTLTTQIASANPSPPKKYGI